MVFVTFIRNPEPNNIHMIATLRFPKPPRAAIHKICLKRFLVGTSAFPSPFFLSLISRFTGLYLPNFIIPSEPNSLVVHYLTTNIKKSIKLGQQGNRLKVESPLGCAISKSSKVASINQDIFNRKPSFLFNDV